jgi:hypothetical protein
MAKTPDYSGLTLNEPEPAPPPPVVTRSRNETESPHAQGSGGTDGYLSASGRIEGAETVCARTGPQAP